MATIQNIRQRAQQLAEKWQKLSISPEEVGLLIDDLAALVNDAVINGSSLGIRRTYDSLSAMNSDGTAPNDQWGDPLKRGQLVAIASSDADAGKIYLFADPNWAYVTTVDARYVTTDALAEEITKIEERCDKIEDTGVDLRSGSRLLFNISGYYNSNSDSYIALDSAVSTPKLKIGTELIVNMYFGGSSYPMYTVNFFDKNKKFLSKFESVDVGVQKIIFNKDNIPEETVYYNCSTILQYAEDIAVYSNSVFTYADDIEGNTKSIQDNTIRINSVEASMKYEIKPTIQGSVNYLGQIKDTDLAKRTDYIPIVFGMSLTHFYDGASQYNTYRAFAFYDDEKKFISVVNYDAAGYKDIVLTEDNTPINARFIIASTLTSSIETSIITIYKIDEASTKAAFLKGELGQVEVEVDKNAQSIGEIGTQLNGKVNIVSKEFENSPIAVTIFCELPKAVIRFSVSGDGAPEENFNLYKKPTENASSGELVLLGVKQPNTDYVIEKDDENPYLYIYKGGSYTCNIKVSYSSENRGIQKEFDDVKTQIQTTYMSSYAGKTIVVFGDSITEFSYPDPITGISMRYSDYIQELTGANVVNVGIGGSQFRQRSTPTTSPSDENEARGALDIVNMVRSSCEQDFSCQDAAVVLLPQYAKVIQRLKSIVWENVAAVIILGGTNDWKNAGLSMGESGSKAVNLTLGAINDIIERLMGTYKHVSLYWFTPIVRYLGSSIAAWDDSQFSDVYQNAAEKSLKEFCEIITSEISAKHVPVCDLYNTFGWNKYNFSNYFLDNDGTHPYKGFGHLGRKILSFIESNKSF